MRDAIIKELQSVVASALSVTTTLISRPTPYNTELTDVLPVHDEKVNVKVHTLDTAPLRSKTPLQKRSGMARVRKGSHSVLPVHLKSHMFNLSFIYSSLFTIIGSTKQTKIEET